SRLECPVLHGPVRLLHVHVQPDVRIDPFHLRDGAFHRDRLVRVELCRKGMMCRQRRRRSHEKATQSRDRNGQLRTHWLQPPAITYRRYHSYSLSPGGTFRVMSTIIVSPSQRFTSWFLRRFPYRNSSTNSMQRYSSSCAFGSRRRSRGIEICTGATVGV